MIFKRLSIIVIGLLFSINGNSQEVLKGFETEFSKAEHYGNWSSIDGGNHDYSFYIDIDTIANNEVLSML